MRSHISVCDTFISPPIPVPPPPLLNVQNVVYCQSVVSEPCHCITELHFIYQIIRIPPLKKIWQNDCIIAHGLIFFLQQYKKCLSLNCGSNRYMYICNVSSTAKTGSFQSKIWIGSSWTCRFHSQLYQQLPLASDQTIR